MKKKLWSPLVYIKICQRFKNRPFSNLLMQLQHTTMLLIRAIPALMMSITELSLSNALIPAAAGDISPATWHSSRLSNSIIRIILSIIYTQKKETLIYFTRLTGSGRSFIFYWNGGVSGRILNLCGILLYFKKDRGDKMIRCTYLYTSN